MLVVHARNLRYQMLAVRADENTPWQRRGSAAQPLLKPVRLSSSLMRSENAQRIAGDESPRTTKLYDRTIDAITLDEVERIVI